MSNRIAWLTALERLEPCAGKLACTVLRGADNSNVVGLLDFSFMGNQYRIQAQGREYFIDLLFYNRRMQCLVAFELKKGKFEPEYAGKMNFYLNLLDDFVREPHENPSIGIVLCSERDRFEVEYAIRGMKNPVGIAEFRLQKSLPTELMDKLPNPKQIADELRRNIEKEDLEEID